MPYVVIITIMILPPATLWCSPLVKGVVCRSFDLCTRTHPIQYWNINTHIRQKVTSFTFPDFWCSWKASMSPTAHSIRWGEGEKACLTTGTWSGWITCFPVYPMRAPSSACLRSPSKSVHRRWESVQSSKRTINYMYNWLSLVPRLPAAFSRSLAKMQHWKTREGLEQTFLCSVMLHAKHIVEKHGKKACLGMRLWLTIVHCIYL